MLPLAELGSSQLAGILAEYTQSRADWDAVRMASQSRARFALSHSAEYGTGRKGCGAAAAMAAAEGGGAGERGAAAAAVRLARLALFAVYMYM